MGDPVNIRELLGQTPDAVPAMVHPVAGTTYANTGSIEPGFVPEAPGAAAAATLAAGREELYGGVGGGVGATVLGGLRGFTLGGSDAVLSGAGFVDSDVLRDVRDTNPGLSFAGELGGSVALTAVTGGAGGIGAAAAPGSKAAAAMIAGGIEGAAFGAGQATSSLVLRNEPLTAEAVFTEYGTDIFLGGATGAGGGLLGHGISTFGGKLRAKSAARLSKDPEALLAANALEGGVPIDSARGRVLTDDFVKGVDNSTKLADEIAAEVAKRPVILEAPAASAGKPTSIAELPDEMFSGEGITSGRNAIQFVTDAADEAVMAAKGSGNAALKPAVRKAESASRKLRGLLEDDLGASASGPNATTVGTGATKGRMPALDAPRIKAQFAELHDATVALAKQLDDPGILDNLMQGAKLPDGSRKGGLAQFFDDGATVTMPPKPGSLPVQVKESAKAYAKARTELFDALYVRDGQIASKRTLSVLGELEPAEAMKVAQSYSAYVKHANAMGEALGPEFVAKTQLLSQELSKVQKAVRSLVTPESAVPGAPQMSTADIMGALGIAEAIPDMDGPADDMAKLWLTAALLKGRFKGAGAVESAGGNGMLKGAAGWVKNTGGRVGYRMGAQGGGVVTGGIKGAMTSTAARWGLDKIMGSTVGLAKTTARAAARAEGAVGRMLEATGTGVRKAAPFAPNALLKSVRFADLEHDPKSTDFEKRAREIRMNVANSFGVQKTVNDNLGELGVHHPGVADKTIAQADRFMKFLGMKLPRDPGTVTGLGKSKWRASEQDIAKFARYVRAAVDPDGELERIAEGDLSVEGAETIRLLYPAKFAKFQEYIGANLEQLQENLDFAGECRLSILFNVPVNSAMDPKNIRAFQATFAADSTASPVSQPPPGSNGPSPLSPAQELLAR